MRGGSSKGDDVMNEIVGADRFRIDTADRLLQPRRSRWWGDEEVCRLGRSAWERNC